MKVRTSLQAGTFQETPPQQPFGYLNPPPAGGQATGSPLWEAIQRAADSLSALGKRLYDTMTLAEPTSSSIPWALPGAADLWELDAFQGGAVITAVFEQVTLLIGLFNATFASLLRPFSWLLRLALSLAWWLIFIGAGLGSRTDQQVVNKNQQPVAAPFWEQLASFFTLLLTSSLIFSGVWSVGDSLFIALFGLTLFVRRARGETTAAFLQQSFILLAAGLLVSLSTYLFLPSFFIGFGLFSFLGLATLLLIPFCQQSRWVNLVAGAFLTTLGIEWQTAVPAATTSILGTIGGWQPAPLLLDNFPLVPWLGIALLGLFMGQTLYSEGERRFWLPDLAQAPTIKRLKALSEDSLLIFTLQSLLTFLGRPFVPAK